MLVSRKIELYLIFQLLVLSGLYFIYIVGGYKSFSVWSQIDVLAGANPIQTLSHPHGLRYLVTWPVIALAEYFDIDRNKIFSLFVILNITACAILTSWAQSRLSKDVEKRWVGWFYLYFPIFLMLSYPMNGRLSYMLLGTALILFSYISWVRIIIRQKPFWRIVPYVLLNILALSLLSVSSGCFTVGLVVILLHSIVFLIIAQNWVSRIFYSVINLASMTGFLFIQWLFIKKNLVFYDGSLLGMLVHGPGEIITVINPSRALLSFLIATAVFASLLIGQQLKFFIRQQPFLITPLLLVIVSLVIGLYGYSTLLTGTTALLVLVTHIGGALLREEGAPPGRLITDFMHHHILKPRITAGQWLLNTVVFLMVVAIGMATLPEDWSIYRKNLDKDNLESHATLYMDSRYYATLTGTLLPGPMVIDSRGNVYLVDNSTRLIRINTDHTMEIFAGSQQSGDRDGQRAQALFGNIKSIVFDDSDTLYIADELNHKIKSITADGDVKTIAGRGTPGLPKKGCFALECHLNAPSAITVLYDNQGLLISLPKNQIVVRLASDGKIYPYLQLGRQ
jgi:hypothetical protein